MEKIVEKIINFSTFSKALKDFKVFYFKFYVFSIKHLFLMVF
jgi:hypothetical protein